MKRTRILPSLACSALALLAACQAREEQPTPPRPVLSVVATSPRERRPTFTGTIQPRYSTERGFLVLGRIVARPVYVGDRVHRGQALAKIEPLTYELAVRSGEADLARARAELDRAQAAQGRTASLADRGISPRSERESADRTAEAAAAGVRQAEANLAKARENLRYTALTADGDGVVTNTYADVGQMASQGMRVLTVARTDAREAVVDLPEDVVQALRPGSPFTVALLADSAFTTGGTVREIAPQAAAATRTRQVRIALDRPEDPFRLGATVAATPLVAAGPEVVEVPETALVERDGRTRVWVVDAEARTVRSVPVAVADRGDGVARIAEGIASGTRVVVAGVDSLKDGQAVAIDEGGER